VICGVIVAATLGSAAPAVAKTDPAKAGCVELAAAYSSARNGAPAFAAGDNLSTFSKAHNKKLGRLVAAVILDDTDQVTLDRLARWCATHYPKVKSIRTAALVARTTTTTSTTTTTLPPQPVVYDGSGDDVIQITKPAQLNVVDLTYNGGGNFIVVPLDASQQRTGGSLANEIGAYHGIVPLDLLSGANTVYFQIQSSGPWHIEIRSANTVRQFDTTIDGSGDEVLIYQGKMGIATLTHDGSSNFIVIGYSGTGRNGMVNVIGNYNGRVPIAAGPALIEVKADGHWTIATA
jgi:hypothetical protein